MCFLFGSNGDSLTAAGSEPLMTGVTLTTCQETNSSQLTSPLLLADQVRSLQYITQSFKGLRPSNILRKSSRPPDNRWRNHLRYKHIRGQKYEERTKWNHQQDVRYQSHRRGRSDSDPTQEERKEPNKNRRRTRRDIFPHCNMFSQVFTAAFPSCGFQAGVCLWVCVDCSVTRPALTSPIAVNE